MMDDERGRPGLPPQQTTNAADEERAMARGARQGRTGDVPPKAVQEQEQMREAVQQKAEAGGVGLNEGGRTNDSTHQENPPGAVHGLPAPALKGTWR